MIEATMLLKTMPMEGPFWRGMVFGEHVGTAPLDDAKTSSNATSSADGLMPAIWRGFEDHEGSLQRLAQDGAH
jgi:hypothetical protein